MGHCCWYPKRYPDILPTWHRSLKERVSVLDLVLPSSDRRCYPCDTPYWCLCPMEPQRWWNLLLNWPHRSVQKDDNCMDPSRRPQHHCLNIWKDLWTSYPDHAKQSDWTCTVEAITLRSQCLLKTAHLISFQPFKGDDGPIPEGSIFDWIIT